MRKIIPFVVFAFILGVLLLNRYTGFLNPYIPVLGYYGVEPLNESWKTCKGEIGDIIMETRTSDNMKKFDYWMSRAVKENNAKLCSNVGYLEGGDVYHEDNHKAAIDQCLGLIKYMPSVLVKSCGDVY